MGRENVPILGRVCAIVAHPDDAEINCGGWLAREGGLIVCLTNGGNHTRDAETAEHEQKCAAGVLGCDYFISPHTAISTHRRTVEMVDRLLADFACEVVLTHPDRDTNQEHRAASEVALAAARRLDKVLFFEPVPPAGRFDFRPQFYVDISDTAERKYDAINAFTSQRQLKGRDVVNTRMKLDSWRGCEIDVEYAEAYEVVRWRL